MNFKAWVITVTYVGGCLMVGWGINWQTGVGVGLLGWSFLTCLADVINSIDGRFDEDD